MLNLSITTCSFYLKKSRAKIDRDSYFINQPINVIGPTGKELTFKNAFELFEKFFSNNTEIIDDSINQRAFKCAYNGEKIETNEYIMYPILIHSGVYGSASDIINIETKKIQYSKKPKDVDFKQFYFIIVFPKDSTETQVQKGMFIFQNIGSYGIKTVVTQKIQQFLSTEYNITLTCNTISPALFVKKLLNEKTIKEITMIRNIKSADLSDSFRFGYGQVRKTIAKLNFSETVWENLISKMIHITGAKNNMFEFENIAYDRVKVEAKIGERIRTITLNNIENLSIIESLPNEIKNIDGNADKNKLIEYLHNIIKEYLEEMVLYF